MASPISLAPTGISSKNAAAKVVIAVFGLKIVVNGL